MSEQVPFGPPGSGYQGGNPKAQAKAEKAYRKAQRPLYKKKRVLIPAGLVAVGVIAVASGGGSKSTDTAGSSSSSTAPVTSAPESAAAPTTAAPAGSTYVGQLKDDKLAGGAGTPGAEVALSGWTVTASALKVTKTSFSNNLCSDVGLVNRDKKQQDYNGLSWKLQTPGGDVQDITFSGENDLSTGALAPGGKVAKSVCFDNKGGAGKYVLSWTPDVFSSKARGVWLNTQ